MIQCPFCDYKNPPGATHCASCNAELPESAEPAKQDSAAALMALIEKGQTIEAIKLYRERTGAGLKEAKDAVEALARGERPAMPQALSNSAEGISNAPEQEIVSLLKNGKKIAAIKLYREKTGSGLADAKNAVEALASNHGIVAKASGCSGVLLSIVMIVLALACLIACR